LALVHRVYERRGQTEQVPTHRGYAVRVHGTSSHRPVPGFTLSTLSGRKSLLAPHPIDKIPRTGLLALVHRVYERRGQTEQVPTHRGYAVRVHGTSSHRPVPGFTLSTLSGRKSLLAPDPIDKIPRTGLLALVYRG
jgi:hypothetical protein